MAVDLIDPNAPKSGSTEPVDEGYDDSDLNRTEGKQDPKSPVWRSPTSGPRSGGTGYKNYGSPPQGSSGTGNAGWSDPGEPQTPPPGVNDLIKQLTNQGYSASQIQDAVFQQFGVWLSEGDVQYYQQGGLGGPDVHDGGYNGGQYKQYGNPPPQQKFYGSPQWNQWEQDLTQQAQDQARNIKKEANQNTMRLSRMLVLIMMGDLVGAMRVYWHILERDSARLARASLEKLNKVREVKQRLVYNMAHARIPKAYAGQDKKQGANSQDQASEFNVFMQTNNQAISEVSNLEREIVDGIVSIRREVDNFGQAFASLRDSVSRLDERIMQFRG